MAETRIIPVDYTTKEGVADAIYGITKEIKSRNEWCEHNFTHIKDALKDLEEKNRDLNDKIRNNEIEINKLKNDIIAFYVFVVFISIIVTLSSLGVI